LTAAGEYTAGRVFTVFFSVIIGAFALGQASPSLEAAGLFYLVLFFNCSLFFVYVCVLFGLFYCLCLCYYWCFRIETNITISGSYKLWNEWICLLLFCCLPFFFYVFFYVFLMILFYFWMTTGKAQGAAYKLFEVLERKSLIDPFSDEGKRFAYFCLGFSFLLCFFPSFCYLFILFLFCCFILFMYLVIYS
jgi:hypothetical protein